MGWIIIIAIAMMAGCSQETQNDQTFSRDMYDLWYDQEQFDTALRHIDERLELYPKDALLHNERGLTLHYLGQYNEALEAFDQAIELDPNVDSMYDNKATTLNQLGEYEQAIVFAQKALDRGNEGLGVFINMGHAHLGLERYEQALPYYEEALAIEPNARYALHGKGVSLYMMHEDEQALTYLQQYVNAYPEDPDGLWYIIYVLDSLGHLEKAAFYGMQLSELGEDLSAYSLDYIGLLLMDAGFVEQSEEIYDQIIDNDRFEAIGYYGKGVALIQQGENDVGIEMLSLALNTDESLKEVASNDVYLEPVLDEPAFIELLQ